MICVFCNAHEDEDVTIERSWTSTFWWRLRVYEGPVCPSCTYNHLHPRLLHAHGIIEDCVLMLNDNDELPLLAILSKPPANFHLHKEKE